MSTKCSPRQPDRSATLCGWGCRERDKDKAGEEEVPLCLWQSYSCPRHTSTKITSRIDADVIKKPAPCNGGWRVNVKTASAAQCKSSLGAPCLPRVPAAAQILMRDPRIEDAVDLAVTAFLQATFTFNCRCCQHQHPKAGGLTVLQATYSTDAARARPLVKRLGAQTGEK